MPRFPQISFGGGELDPGLHAHADLNKYQVGLKKSLNCLVAAQGGLYNRSGMIFSDYTYSSGGDYPKSRIIAFDVDNNDVTTLILTGNRMWFARFGAILKLDGTYDFSGDHPTADFTIAGGAGDIMELETPWDQNTFDKVKFAQFNDTMTLTVHGESIYELRRHGFYDWALYALDFQPGIDPPANVVATANIDLTVPSGVADPTIYDTTIYYVVSAVADSGEESLASTPDSCVNDLSWKKNNNVITWDAVTGAVKYNVYKAKNSIYGFIGTTTELTFKDDNINPSLGDTPKTGKNPFLDPDRKPSVVEFYQQRRIFANYEASPQSLDASASGNFYSFNASTPSKDDDAISATIAASRRQAIHWFIPLEELLMFTQSGEWKIVGSNGNSVLTPSSIDPRPQSFYGSVDYLKPIVIGDRVIFVQALGHIVYDLGYQVVNNRYVADDLTVLSSHLFKGRTIKKWDYDSQNYVLWMVMSDGKAVTISYNRQHEMWAACQHDTDGIIEDVLCIPEDDRVVTQFLVQRKNKNGFYRSFERLDNRDFVELEDAVFLDACLSFDDPYLITNAVLTGDLDTGFSIVLGIVDHPFVVGNIIDIADLKGFRDLDNPYDKGIKGQYEVTDVDLDGYHVTIRVDTDVDLSKLPGWDLNTATARRTVTTLTGLSHLAGREVRVLADGAVYGDIGELTVSDDGEITLPERFARAHVGLPYVSEVETLDIELNTQTSQGILRRVRRASLRVKDSRGIFLGPNFQELTEYFPREFENYNQAPDMYSGYIHITCTGSYKDTGLVCIRQPNPLPMHILAVSPEVEYGTNG